MQISSGHGPMINELHLKMLMLFIFISCILHQTYLFTPLTHWGRDKMAFILQTTLSNAFSWMKMLEFGLKFHWSLFLRLQTLGPRQNGLYFADDTFKRIFLNENARIWIEISLKFVPKGPINNSPALVQIMAWRRPGDKPLSELMMARLLTHICVPQPQWVKNTDGFYIY